LQGRSEHRGALLASSRRPTTPPITSTRRAAWKPPFFHIGGKAAER